MLSGFRREKVVPLRDKLKVAMSAAEHTTPAAAHSGVGHAGHQSLDGEVLVGGDKQYAFEDEPPASLTTRIRAYQIKVQNADALEASLHRQASDLADERKECARLKLEIAAELGITAGDFQNGQAGPDNGSASP